MKRNWANWAVCENCLNDVQSQNLPAGWTETGMSKLPMRMGKLAQYCPDCSPRSLVDEFFSKPVEVTGTINVQCTTPPTKERANKGVPMKPTLKEAIQKVSQAMQNLLVSGLNQDAIVVLIHDRCPM